MSRGGWVRRLAEADLVGLLLVVVGVLLLAAVLTQLPVWYAWLLGLPAVALALALVFGHAWARSLVRRRVGGPER